MDFFRRHGAAFLWILTAPMALGALAQGERLDLNEGWALAGRPGLIELPADLSPPGPDGLISLTRPLALPEAWRGQEIALALGQVDYPFELRANGKLLVRSGQFPPQWRAELGRFQALALGPELFADGQSPLLTLTLYKDGGAAAVPAPWLGPAQDVALLAALATYGNQTIYAQFGFVCLFIGLFYGLQFLFRPQNRANLWFAGANVFFGLYFLRMGVGMELLPHLASLAWSRGLLALAFGSLTLFFLEQYPFWSRRWLKILIGVLAGLLFLSTGLLGRTTAQLDLLFLTILAPGQLQIFFMVAIALRAALTGRREAWVILAGTAWGVGLGTHDIVMEFSGQTPLFWFQGLGIFGFNLAMFFVLAVQAIRDSRDLERTTAELNRKSAALEASLGNIRQAAVGVTGIMLDLDQGIDGAGKTVRHLADHTQAISLAVSEEAAFAGQTLSHTEELLTSLNTVYGGLSAQSQDLDRTAGTLRNLTEGLDQVTDQLKATADFTVTLQDTVRAGEKAVSESQKAMARIHKSSQIITGLIDTVTDIAERTNLLSMNAAIEAAHAGLTGRGFAVVAQEIKKLADSSGQQARAVSTNIAEITSAIEAGAQTTGQVRAMLMHIQAQADGAAAQVQELYAAVARQRQAGLEVLRALDELAATGQSIKHEADDQSTASRNIRERMEALVQNLEVVRQRAESIDQEQQALVSVAKSMSRIAGESRDVTAGLTALLGAQGGQ